MKTGQWISIFLIAIFMAGCGSFSTPTPGFGTAVPGAIEPPNPSGDSAQATIEFGKRQLLDLDYQATKVSLNMVQAANAAAQLTQDVQQRLKIDLDNQSTQVSQNITQAAYTQEFLQQQTRIALEATMVAQNSAATATQSAYLVISTQTAQAQATANAQVQQTEQAVAALTAYPLTATPFAVTKAALLMQQYDREQQAFVDNIVIPWIPVILILEILLVAFLIFFVYRQYMLRKWPRRLHLTPIKVIPISASITERVTLVNKVRPDPQLPAKLTQVIPLESLERTEMHIEIVDAAVLPVARWVAEVEIRLADDEGFQV